MNSPIIRTPLLAATLTPPKSASRIEVQRIDFGPGQKSPLHLHPCPVVGYVVKGSVHFQIEGQEAQTLEAGDAFFEPAQVRVSHFDNASPSEGMSFVACYWMGDATEEKVKIL